MKHKHAEFIHLMANGVRIETAVNGGWIGAYWGDFNDNNLTFRISPNQPADEDGWIPWRGGENPVKGERVDVKFKDQGCLFNLFSTNFDWWHNRSARDIVAYRIVKQEKKWRWMYAVADNRLYMTPPMTEAEVKAWAAERPSGYKLGPRQDWTEVCDD